jgi:hypothetical protein
VENEGVELYERVLVAEGRLTPADYEAILRFALTNLSPFEILPLMASLELEAYRAAGIRLRRDLRSLRALLFAKMRVRVRDPGDLGVLGRLFGRLAEFARRAAEVVRELAALLSWLPAPMAPAIEPPEAGLPPPEPLLAALILAPAAPPRASGRN